MVSLYYRAVAWENESVRGSRWPGQLDIDPHEVAGGLYNSGGWSLRRHAPEPSAREANLVGTLHGGPGEGIRLGRQAKWVKEAQSPQYQLVGVSCGCIRPGARQDAGIFTGTGHIAGSEAAILAIFTNGEPVLSGGGMGE